MSGRRGPVKGSDGELTSTRSSRRWKMSVSLETYDRRYLEEMTALYNAETAFEPHIAPLDPERFVALVESKSYFDPDGLFVARQDGRVVGWAHVCVAPSSEGHHDPAEPSPRLCMLIFPRDRLPVGGALVSAATAWLRRAGQAEILAMHPRRGYPFYRGLWLGGEPMGPATMPHVQLALAVAGYRATQQDVFMTTETRSPPTVLASAVNAEFVESAAEMKHEPMRESWIGFEPRRITVHVGGELAGGIGWVVLPHMADRLGTPCMNIWDLWVREKHRRNGLGAALVSRAMAGRYGRGARFASVLTPLWNGPAHRTYAKCGFQPPGLNLGRTLDDGRHPGTDPAV
jgi:GNAT superfamily N-acetyltransferase